MTPYQSRAAYRIQTRAPGRTDYRHFAGRSHFPCNEPGWEEVAETIIAWAASLESTRPRS